MTSRNVRFDENTKSLEAGDDHHLTARLCAKMSLGELEAIALGGCSSSVKSDEEIGNMSWEQALSGLSFSPAAGQDFHEFRTKAIFSDSNADQKSSARTTRFRPETTILLHELAALGQQFAEKLYDIGRRGSAGEHTTTRTSENGPVGRQEAVRAIVSDLDGEQTEKLKASVLRKGTRSRLREAAIRKIDGDMLYDIVKRHTGSRSASEASKKLLRAFRIVPEQDENAYWSAIRDDVKLRMECDKNIEDVVTNIRPAFILDDSGQASLDSAYFTHVQEAGGGADHSGSWVEYKACLNWFESLGGLSSMDESHDNGIDDD